MPEEDTPETSIDELNEELQSLFDLMAKNVGKTFKNAPLVETLQRRLEDNGFETVGYSISLPKENESKTSALIVTNNPSLTKNMLKVQNWPDGINGIVEETTYEGKQIPLKAIKKYRIPTIDDLNLAKERLEKSDATYPNNG